MHSSIYSFIFLTLFTLSSCLRYGQKYWRPYRQNSWRPRPRCDEFDPPAVRNFNFDDIAGKWHLVRMKPERFPSSKRDPTKDANVEWICGTNKAIRSFRLLDKPSFCVIFLLEFIPIPGTDHSAFSLFMEDLNLTIDWRVLHLDSKFLLTWGCFDRDGNNRCIDWASGVFKRTPNATISDRDLRRLDVIIKRTTCEFRIKKEFETQFVGNECQDWSLRMPQSTECPKRY